MMSPYPFFGFPSFRRPYPYYPIHNPHSHPTNSTGNASFPSNFSHDNKKSGNHHHESFGNIQSKDLCDSQNKVGEEEKEDCFEFFGLKLYFDDLLLIALLFFLYQEDVKDTYLYIALVLLLLS